ncbi:MAG: endonuclease [Proteobacteria bacterium]|nr:endonuclease [Pseudomonadota bacterium]
MLRSSLALLLAMVLTLPVYAQSLAPGDIAIIGVNSDNPDQFGFVALVDLPAGTAISFVDHGWKASGSFRTNEDEYTFTSSATVPKGTVILVESGAPAFSTSGDQLFAFQGTVESPAIIYGINFEDTGWQTDATSSNTSALPPTLVNGSTAVAIDECDNIAYNGPTTGSKSALLTLIGDKANWTCDDSTRLTFALSFSVSGTSGNALPSFTEPTVAFDAVAGTTVNIQYAAQDSDMDPLTFGGIGLPLGANVNTSTGIFSWTPSESNVGPNTFTITVTDGKDTASISVTITVTSLIESKRPRFTVIPPDTLVGGGLNLSIPFSVTDPDAFPIASYTVTPADLGASINNSEFSWTTPLIPDIYRFTITAQDAEGLTVSYDLFIGISGELYSGQLGSALLESLKGVFTPVLTLGYDVARDTMYAKVDLDLDGFVRGIYTGFAVAYTTGDPSTEMFNAGINAEHTWPQSMGAENEPQRSDLHFLFPAKDNVNSTRSNHPYADIPDNQTTTWFVGSSSQSAMPTVDIDTYSEFASGRFEPRESVKGDVSRAVLYFNTIYSSAANSSFFAEQKATLLSWATQDLPSGKEIRRSGLIRKYQGNINPLLLDQSLGNRLFGTATNVEGETLPQQLKIDAIFPNPSFGALSVRISTMANTSATVSLYNVLGERLSVKSVVLPGGLIDLPVNLKDYTSGVYFVSVTSDKGSQTRSVFKY